MELHWLEGHPGDNFDCVMIAAAAFEGKESAVKAINSPYPLKSMYPVDRVNVLILIIRLKSGWGYDCSYFRNRKIAALM